MYYCLSHDVVTWDVDHDVSTALNTAASLLQMMRLNDCTASFMSHRSAVISAYRSSHCSFVPASRCLLIEILTGTHVGLRKLFT